MEVTVQHVYEDFPSDEDPFTDHSVIDQHDITEQDQAIPYEDFPDDEDLLNHQVDLQLDFGKQYYQQQYEDLQSDENPFENMHNSDKEDESDGKAGIDKR